jgi:hypothetical protein
LPPLAECAELAALAPPPDVASRSLVDGLRGALAHARVLEEAGRSSEARELASRAVAFARAIRYDPVLAEALLLLGSVELAQRRDRARADLEEAFAIAESSRSDRTATRAALALAGELASNGSAAGTKRWLRLAATILERTPTDVEATVRLDFVRALDLRSHAAYDEALAALGRSLDAQRKLAGLDSLEELRIRDAIVETDRRAARPADALTEAHLSLATAERLFGANHPAIATELVAVAGVLDELGQPHEAAALRERARALAR